MDQGAKINDGLASTFVLKNDDGDDNSSNNNDDEDAVV